VETVKYQLLDSMLINELQKQNVTITAQKKQLRAQEQQIQSLAERLAAVEAALRQSPVTTSSH
jgi:septal ring factor EnvC (AmiA/AmiB activator)